MANTPDLDLLRDEPEPVAPDDEGSFELIVEDDGALECGDGEDADEVEVTGSTRVPKVSAEALSKVQGVLIGRPRSN